MRWAKLWPLLSPGVPSQAATDRVMWRGSMRPTAVRQAAPWRPNGRRMATLTAPSLPGSPGRQMACRAQPQAAMDRDMSVGASWHIGGGWSSAQLWCTQATVYKCNQVPDQECKCAWDQGWSHVMWFYSPVSPAVHVPPQPWRKPEWQELKCWQSSNGQAKVS
jgi:hypothetical protein